MTAVIVSGPDRPPLGVALTIATDDPFSRVVVLSPSPGLPVPEERLARLLLSDLGIGVVVPRLAGARVSSPAADVDRAAHPWVAFRRDLLAGRAVPLHAAPPEVAGLAVTAAQAAGLRVVYDPGWVVEAGGQQADRAEQPASRPAGQARPMLVVTDYLGSGLRPDECWTRQLVEDLTSLAGNGSVTVAVLDGFGAAGSAAALEEAGVAVVAGPLDWSAWFAAQWGRFEHIAVTRAAVSRPLRELLDLTQPQAVRVLALDTLPFRPVDGLLPAAHPGDHPALRHLSEAGKAVLGEWMQSFGVVVCARSADADYLRAVFPPRAVATVPPAPPLQAAAKPPQERRGVVLLGSAGYDLTLGQEDSIQVALAGVIPGLRSHQPDLPVTVVADQPSPELERAIAGQNLDLVPTSTAAETVGAARLVLALHRYGAGGPVALLAALASGTPFLATPAAAADLDLGPLRAQAVSGDHADIGLRARRLLRDDTHWAETADLVSRLAADTFQEPARLAPLRNLLAVTGRDTAGVGAGGPDARPGWWPRPAWPAPAGRTAAPAGHTPTPSSDQRPGPTQAERPAPAGPPLAAPQVAAPRVTVIISTRDGGRRLEACVSSITERSTYRNRSILVVDNDSRDGATLGYLASAPATVLRYPYPANPARQLNLAATAAESEVLLFLADRLFLADSPLLADSTEVAVPDWIERMLEQALRPEVGACIGGAGGRDALAVRSTVYRRVGGHDVVGTTPDPGEDLCRRIRRAGFEVVRLPSAELFRHRREPSRHRGEPAPTVPVA